MYLFLRRKTYARIRTCNYDFVLFVHLRHNFCVCTYCALIVTTMLLLLSGDIHTNPGPNEYTDLALTHVNIRSLSDHKLRDIRTSLASDFDVIAVSETFLNSSKSSEDLQIPGFYPILRRDRAGAVGGGVALCVTSPCLSKDVRI